MKHILRIISPVLALLALGLLFTGCSSVSQSDRDFFYSGWTNPNAPDKQDMLPPQP
jgi:hypothetical protein